MSQSQGPVSAKKGDWKVPSGVCGVFSTSDAPGSLVEVILGLASRMLGGIGEAGCVPLITGLLSELPHFGTLCNNVRYYGASIFGGHHQNTHFCVHHSVALAGIPPKCSVPRPSAGSLRKPWSSQFLGVTTKIRIFAYITVSHLLVLRTPPERREPPQALVIAVFGGHHQNTHFCVHHSVALAGIPPKCSVPRPSAGSLRKPWSSQFLGVTTKIRIFAYITVSHLLVLRPAPRIPQSAHFGVHTCYPPGPAPVLHTPVALVLALSGDYP
ncbi:hypothetical protein C8R43DRAFT_961341 [Mycena crocata]|nr:hypothetical protein C8R43DRAFT_961341 [Mycena crocata]